MKLLLGYLKEYKKLIYISLLLAAINQVFSLLDPAIFRHVIDDYAKFDTYLNDKGYATRILVGTVDVTVGDDYKTIAQALCR